MIKSILVDAHVHLALDGIDFQEARLQHKNNPNSIIITNVLRKYKKMGICALRDGGDNLNVSLLARELALEEGMILRTPGFAIYKQGCYGSFLGKPVADMADFKNVFKKLLASNPDHLKILLTGLVDFNQFGKVDGSHFSYDEMYYMIQTAKDQDLPVMVHTNSAEAVGIAVKAGANTIEHGYFLTENELQLMLEHDTIWIPTLAPLGNLIVSKDSRFTDQLPNIARIYDAQKAQVKKAFELGIKIAVGSDAGSYGVSHGKGFYDEVGHMVMTGISKRAILELATANGIGALNLNNKELDYIFQAKKSVELRNYDEDSSDLL